MQQGELAYRIYERLFGSPSFNICGIGVARTYGVVGRYRGKPRVPDYLRERLLNAIAEELAVKK